jgi:hypothetical protein
VLRVSLHVQKPSVVELTVAETVQMDRLTPTPEGYAADLCGELLIPGPTTLMLEQGIYLFETMLEAHMRIIDGDVDAVTTTSEWSATTPTTGEPRPEHVMALGSAARSPWPSRRQSRWTPRHALAVVRDEATASEAPAFTIE